MIILSFFILIFFIGFFVNIISVFIYFIPMFAFTRIYYSDSNQFEWVETSTEPSGKNGGIFVLGTSIYVCLICAMHWKVMWHTYSWTWVPALFMLGFSFPLFILFFSVSFLAATSSPSNKHKVSHKKNL